MHKSGFIDEVAKEAESSRTTVERVVNASLKVITQSLQGGEDVVLIGFGSFSVREHGPRVVRHIQTGQPVHVAASKRPAFKVGKQLKAAINQTN